jgi:hypothetical protein
MFLGRVSELAVEPVVEPRQLVRSIENEEDVIKVRGNWRMPTYLNMTLEKFAKLFPKGRYIVVKSNHALALIDGVWYDNHEPNPRARVKHFYKIA